MFGTQAVAKPASSVARISARDCSSGRAAPSDAIKPILRFFIPFSFSSPVARGHRDRAVHPGAAGQSELRVDAVAPFHLDHLAVYGAGNERRLTGEHETASMEKFSFGPSDRSASIRIPIYTIKHDWKGYLEDRRPASDGDPYLIADRIIKTVRIAHPKAIESIG